MYKFNAYVNVHLLGKEHVKSVMFIVLQHASQK